MYVCMYNYMYVSCVHSLSNLVGESWYCHIVNVEVGKGRNRGNRFWGSIYRHTLHMDSGVLYIDIHYIWTLYMHIRTLHMDSGVLYIDIWTLGFYI